MNNMYECFLPSNHYYGFGSISKFVILSDEIVEFITNHNLRIKLKETGIYHTILSRKEAQDQSSYDYPNPHISIKDKFIVCGSDKEIMVLFRMSF